MEYSLDCTCLLVARSQSMPGLMSGWKNRSHVTEYSPFRSEDNRFAHENLPTDVPILYRCSEPRNNPRIKLLYLFPELESCRLCSWNVLLTRLTLNRAWTTAPECDRSGFLQVLPEVPLGPYIEHQPKYSGFSIPGTCSPRIVTTMPLAYFDKNSLPHDHPPYFNTLDELDAWATNSSKKLEGLVAYIGRSRSTNPASNLKLLVLLSHSVLHRICLLMQLNSTVVSRFQSSMYNSVFNQVYWLQFAGKYF